MKIGLFIPTLNAGRGWAELLESISEQTVSIDKKLIIDSGSSDSTKDLAVSHGFLVETIEKRAFNHGGTRNYGLNLLNDCDYVIFLTQDVILTDKNAIANLLKHFDDGEVACVYGRQLPHKNANPLAIHAREYNYPPKSMIKEQKLVTQLGFKVSHISNAFCVYRTSYLIECGMFPTNVIIAEDTYLAS